LQDCLKKREENTFPSSSPRFRYKPSSHHCGKNTSMTEHSALGVPTSSGMHSKEYGRCALAYVMLLVTLTWYADWLLTPLWVGANYLEIEDTTVVYHPKIGVISSFSNRIARRSLKLWSTGIFQRFHQHDVFTISSCYFMHKCVV
jgi:hypothetical protein